jgi:hypothetical protein
MCPQRREPIVIAGGLSKRFSALHRFPKQRNFQQLRSRSEAKALKLMIA